VFADVLQRRGLAAGRGKDKRGAWGGVESQVYRRVFAIAGRRRAAERGVQPAPVERRLPDAHVLTRVQLGLGVAHAVPF